MDCVDQYPYKFSKTKLKPEIGLKTELIRGDREYDDNKPETFNPLFPRGGYFGLAALIGPVNLIDIHPSLSFGFSDIYSYLNILSALLLINVFF